MMSVGWFVLLCVCICTGLEAGKNGKRARIDPQPIDQWVDGFLKESIQFPCPLRNSTADTNPIMWYKNTREFRDLDHWGGVNRRGDTLELIYVDWDTKGNYTCEINNKTYTFALNVTDKFSVVHPYIVHDIGDHTETLGSNITLFCLIRGDANTTVTWHYRSTNATSTVYKELSRERGVKESHYTIYDASYNDTGFYSCSVENELYKNKKTGKVTVIPEPTTPTPDSGDVEPLGMRVVYILTACMGAALVVVVVLVACCIHTRRKKRQEAMAVLYMSSDENCIQRVGDTYVVDLDPEWEINRESLILGDELGRGAFGRVVQGTLINMNNRSGSLPVAVKMLREGASLMDARNFMEELKILKYTTRKKRHQNVNALIGCCTQNGALFIVVEYARYGNLRDFLRERRPTGYEEPAEPLRLKYKDLASFSLQVARGMEYLASINMVHRDLAARNILVDEGVVMKIADFGLTRHIPDSEYYRTNGGMVMPIKWMAPEALQGKTYNEKSDVWSYGILVWEIHSLGGTPYATMNTTPSELLETLNAGGRLEQPMYASVEIYYIILMCWKLAPKDRWTFAKIAKHLSRLLARTQDEYLALESYSSEVSLTNMDELHHPLLVYPHAEDGDGEGHHQNSPGGAANHDAANQQQQQIIRRSDSQYSSYSSSSSKDDTLPRMPQLRSSDVTPDIVVVHGDTYRDRGQWRYRDKEREQQELMACEGADALPGPSAAEARFAAEPPGEGKESISVGVGEQNSGDTVPSTPPVVIVTPLLRPKNGKEDER